MGEIKNILITGTSRGIGKYLAHYYAEKGYKVIGLSRSKVEFDLKNYQHVCVDITKENEVKKLFLNIRKEYDQKLDVLINNAGMTAPNFALLTSLKTVQEVFSINVFGTFILAGKPQN